MTRVVSFAECDNRFWMRQCADYVVNIYLQSHLQGEKATSSALNNFAANQVQSVQT
jgi:hypothetical protein